MEVMFSASARKLMAVTSAALLTGCLAVRRADAGGPKSRDCCPRHHKDQPDGPNRVKHCGQLQIEGPKQAPKQAPGVDAAPDSGIEREALRSAGALLLPPQAQTSSSDLYLRNRILRI